MISNATNTFKLFKNERLTFFKFEKCVKPSVFSFNFFGLFLQGTFFVIPRPPPKFENDRSKLRGRPYITYRRYQSNSHPPTNSPENFQPKKSYFNRIFKIPRLETIFTKKSQHFHITLIPPHFFLDENSCSSRYHTNSPAPSFLSAKNALGGGGI